MRKVLAATALVVLLSVSASGFSEFAQALPEKRVDLLPLLVVPSSCDEFSPAFELELPKVVAGGKAGEGYLLAQQSRQLLAEAAGVASSQKYYWLAGLTAHVFYAIYSLQCHSLALDALQKAVEADKKAAAALDAELSLLEFEQGPAGGSTRVLERAREERRRIASAAGGGEVAGKLEAAYRQSSYSWDHALSGDTRIVQAVAGLYSLLEAFLEMHGQARAAREQLEAEVQKAGREWGVERGLAANSLEFIDGEELEQVADEWFAFLPAATRVLSESTPSFRETIRKARLNFEEASALAEQARKTAEAREGGWAGEALAVYSRAVEKAILSSHYSKQVEERSLELVVFLSKAVARELPELNQKARLASGENPVGASLAYGVSSSAASDYEQFAGTPRGVKIREYARLMRELREALEWVEGTPSFAQALDQVEKSLGEARLLSAGAAKDGIATGFYDAKLGEAGKAFEALKSSGQEDFNATARLLLLSLDLKRQLLGELRERFGGLPGEAARLRQLKKFLSQEEREELEIHAASLGLEENAGSLGKAREWMRRKLAELGSRAEKIVSQHLQENSETLAAYSLAELDKPVEAEVFWSARHEIPLDSELPVEVKIRELENALEGGLLEKSPAVEERLRNASVRLIQSRFGETHYARAVFKKIAARTLDRRSVEVSATPGKLVRKTSVYFEAAEGARVVVSERVPRGSGVQVEALGEFEKQLVEEPDGGKAIAVVKPVKGVNQLNFTVEVSNPVSVAKSFSAEGTKLVFAVELKNNLDERIEGLLLEFVEAAGCVTGEVVLQASSAKNASHKRNGGLVAASFSGMGFAPRETQYAWMEVQCSSVSEYAKSKLQELYASPVAPQAAGSELLDAGKAMQAGDYGRAVELLSAADKKISEYLGDKSGAEKAKLQLLEEISSLEQAGLGLLKLDSPVQAFAELQQIGEQVISACGRARKALESGADAAALASEARSHLLQASKLVEAEMSRISGECNSILGDASKSRACLKARGELVSAREKLVLQNPGAAAEFVGRAQGIMDSWLEERGKNLEEKRVLSQLLEGLLENSRQGLEKAAAALESAGRADGREIPAYATASAAKKALEGLVPKLGKALEVLGGGDEAKILSMNSRQLQEWADGAQERLSELGSSLEELRAAAGKEVSAAEKFNQQFGDARSSEKLGEARQKLEQGSYLSAFSIASELNSKLRSAEAPKAGGFGTREIALALSGIAILILLAYAFTKRTPAGDEVDLPQALEEVRQQEAREEEGKKKPTVF